MVEKQNIPVAIIFLKLFNLTLKEVGNEYKIYDGEREIGLLTKDDNNIIIRAELKNGTLRARYENVSFSKRFANNEYEYLKDIDYSIDKSIEGTFHIYCYKGIKGVTHSCNNIIFVKPNDDTKITICINNDSYFSYRLESKEYNDYLIISPYVDYEIEPYDDYDYRILHIINKGKYDSKTGKNQYGYSSELSEDLYCDETKRKVTIYEADRSKNVVKPPKEILIPITKTILEDFEEMTQIDSGIEEGISRIKKTVASINEDLIDNSIAICFGNSASSNKMLKNERVVDIESIDFEQYYTDNIDEIREYYRKINEQTRNAFIEYFEIKSQKRI